MSHFQTKIVLLVLLIALSCVDATAQGTNDQRLQPQIPDSFGVNIDFTEPKRGELNMIATGGFRWVRKDFKWDLTERVKGTYDFGPYERLLAALDAAGLRALFILDYGNPLYDGGAPPRTAATRAAFARWAVAAAKRFANRGILWELYNEPNNNQFWPPGPNVNEYIQLAQEVGKQFRASVPAEKLIGPATSGIDFAFLEACFKAGLLDYWSAVSVHPYRQEAPETVSPDYARLRDLIRTSKPGADIPIISSEWGYSAVWAGMDVEKQGALLARQWFINISNGIPLSIWYEWRNDGMDAQEPEHHFGTVTYQYVPKFPYLAAKTFSRFFDGYTFVKRIDIGGLDDFVFVFQKGSDTRIAAWTITKRPHRIRLSLGAGKYELINHLGDSLPSVTTPPASVTNVTPEVLLEITDNPIYLRRESP
ncbi:MAG TPA: cellulase family glycosylhydrolase [Pyrinomonadaceae bacterium]|nr:cellulase family glycosylhydrolase [Pyrinomonadaceae bacterium]